MDIWERILDKYGLPVLIVFVGAVVIYKFSTKVLIPYMKRQDERLQEQHKAMVETLNTQLTEARQTREREIARFTDTINGALAEQTATLRAVAEHVQAGTEDAKRGRR